MQELLLDHVIFMIDLDWYKISLGKDPGNICDSGENAINHWLNHGAGAGLSPNPLFDPDWVAWQAGVPTAEAMFAYFKNPETISPHPYFNLKRWAAERNSLPLEHATGIPLIDYWASSRYRPEAICPFFDENWYVAYYKDVCAELDNGNLKTGFHHFLLHGEREGRLPNPYFASQWYQLTNSDDMSVSCPGMKTRPFRHYCSRATSEGVNPSPLFSEKSYLSNCPDVIEAINSGYCVNAFHHFLTNGAQEGRNSVSLFDATTYHQLNPDLEPIIGTAAYPTALAHYAVSGSAERRQVLDYFNEEWYEENYPESAYYIKNGYLKSGFEHFVWKGHDLGRNPNPYFNTSYYCMMNPDVARACSEGALRSPVQHFYGSGRAEGRIGHPFLRPNIELVVSDDGIKITGQTQRAHVPDMLLERLDGWRFASPEDEQAYFQTLYDEGVHGFAAALTLAGMVTGNLVDVTDALQDERGLSAVIAKIIMSGLYTSTLPSSMQPPRRVSPSVRIALDWAETTTIVDGQFLCFSVSGCCHSMFHAVRSIAVKLGLLTRPLPLPRIPFDGSNLPDQIPGPPHGHAVAFSGYARLPRAEIGDAENFSATLQVAVACGAFEVIAAESELRLGATLPSALPSNTSQCDAETAICMAVYNPAPAELKRQIDSIRQQTYGSWVCIISDESTQDDHCRLYDWLRSDPRFRVIKRDERRGFQFNFENALLHVSDTIRYVCFADQDDIWYPEKLSRLVSAMEISGASLVYSDMDLVSQNAERLPGTLLGMRERTHDSWQDTFFANTVTGAACMFKRELLDLILPLPAVPHLYHDHWSALMAQFADGVAFLNEKLYGYVQHQRNVIGAAETAKIPSFDAMYMWLNILSSPSHTGKQKAIVADYIARHYRLDYIRARLLYEALAARIDDRSSAGTFPDYTNFLTQVQESSPDDTGARRLGAALRHSVTDLAMRICEREEASAKAIRLQEMLAQHCTQARAAAALKSVGGFSGPAGLVQKVGALSIRVVQRQASILFLLPELKAGHFFGGYMGKFQIIRKLLKHGHRVQVVCVDQDSISAHEVEKIVNAFPEFREVFENISITPGRGPSGVDVGEKDVVFATTWWSAHVARHITETLGQERFVYIIQEYEPFTFPMGSYAAMADATYGFGHYAVFSSAQLCKFFASRRISVFTSESAEKNHLVMNNAIWRFDENLPSSTSIKPEGRRRLVFYFRSEAHAARNMHEVTLAALAKAISGGVIGPDWDLFAMGGEGENFEVAGRKVQVLGKLSMGDYRSLLPTFDLALSLMYTPHPSLVPLELAAAGVPTLTTTCDVKTDEEIMSISPMLIPVRPTVDGVVASLRDTINRPITVERRLNNVNWPQSWDDVVTPAFMWRIEEWINTIRSQGSSMRN
ncbi:glycosyltransferase [Azospirillum brasilense]|nr:glycosyltransferase [Azospirillum brasilense]